MPYALFFLSGISGLVFEVLWLRELGLVFGNTAHAVAIAITAFFAGLSVGGFVWGRRAARAADPLLGYALLELGVGASALLGLAVVRLYHGAYASMVGALGFGGPLLVGKALLSTLVLFPPAFLMGGTLPFLAQYVVRAPGRLGSAGGALYAINTAGAALGALAGGFYLPRQFGYATSYAIAMALAWAAGLGALALRARRPVAGTRAETTYREPEPSAREHPPIRWPIVLAWVSGFSALALEVLWTRLLAQVLNNSVYAFGGVLATYLIALAIGASLASLLSRTYARPGVVTVVLLALAGSAVAATLPLFVAVTQGLAYVSAENWSGYLRAIFTAAALLMLLPGILVGSIFPYLFRAVQHAPERTGRLLGRLAGVNALGAIAGALVAGFVLLDAVGLQRALSSIALTYTITGLAFAIGHARSVVVLPVAGIAFTLALAAAVPLPVARLRGSEVLEAVYEGSGGTVAVVRSGDNLVMRLNNHYPLGDTRSALVEATQAHIPLLLHPAPRDVFFLGMGTGITAGASLDHPVGRVIVTELLSEVVTAARFHFAGQTNGLFTDPRASVVVEDGRSYLAGTRERFDVIVADLFTPWHAGTAALYTVEHFRVVRSRLKPGGIFAQWLPLYQLSEREFLIIARTLMMMFPQVTLWRGDFSPSAPIVALVGRTSGMPIDHETLERNVKRLMPVASGETGAGNHMAGLFYAGALEPWVETLSGIPLNTDDRPVIEYLAPKSEVGADRFVGIRLAAFFERLVAFTPPDRDPALASFPPSELRYVGAGLAFYKYHVFRERGMTDSARASLERFLAVVPARAAPALGPVRTR